MRFFLPLRVRYFQNETIIVNNRLINHLWLKHGLIGTLLIIAVQSENIAKIMIKWTHF